MSDGVLTIGAVAYDPKVVTIWEGFRQWFRANDFETTYILYANYERQVEDLIAGNIDVAWNSPLAWIRSRRMAEARGHGAALRPHHRDLVTLAAGCRRAPHTADRARRPASNAARDGRSGRHRRRSRARHRAY